MWSLQIRRAHCICHLPQSAFLILPYWTCGATENRTCKDMLIGSSRIILQRKLQTSGAAAWPLHVCSERWLLCLRRWREEEEVDAGKRWARAAKCTALWHPSKLVNETRKVFLMGQQPSSSSWWFSCKDMCSMLPNLPFKEKPQIWACM